MIKVNKIVGTLNFDNKQEVKRKKLNLKIKNVCLMYEICTIFTNKKAKMQALNYIERWFCLLADKKYLSELSFRSFIKLCESTQLHITSEIEIVRAANAWINYHMKERGKLAIDLIKTIRLPLLSQAAKNNLLRKKSSFSTCTKCVEYIKNSPTFEEQLAIDATCVKLQHRYCGQDNFDVLLSGKIQYPYGKTPKLVSKLPIPNVYRLKRSDLSKSTTLAASACDVNFETVVALNEHLYAISGSERGTSIVSYSIFKRKWYQPWTYSNGHYWGMGACVLAGKIYVSCTRRGDGSATFFSFDPGNGEFLGRADMNVLRREGGCAGFGGRMVVAGGIHMPGTEVARTVEAYDPSGDLWSRMPDMVHGRSHCRLAAVGNKLYVFHGNFYSAGEVFDLHSNRFTCLTIGFPPHRNYSRIVPMGGAMLVFTRSELTFSRDKFKVDRFDLEGGEWSKRSKRVWLEGVHDKCIVINYLCLKFPHF